MNQPVSRRSLVAAIALSPALFPPASEAVAQDTSPFAGLGLPEFDLTVTATAIEGMPATLEAGRYLVNVIVPRNSSDEGGGVQFVRPVDGRVDEMKDFLPCFLGERIGDTRRQ